MTEQELQGLVPLKKASKLFPGHPCMHTIIRWCTRGLADGRRLDSVMIGNRRFISPKAAKRFILDGFNQPSVSAQNARLFLLTDRLDGIIAR